MISQFGITSTVKKIQKLNQRIRAVQGGTAAGKTAGIVGELIHRAQKDARPTITSVVSESFPHLKKGAIRDFLWILESTNRFNPARWNKTDYIYTFETGSKIEFFSVDQAGKVRGPRRDRLFVNEANNIPFETFEQLEVRTREFVFLDWNPVSEFWFETELNGKRTDVEHIILTYRDNEALDDSIVASIEARRHRPGWWRVYGEGLVGEVEGRIYTDWNTIDEIPHEARLERYGLDFGYHPDPAALVAVYWYNGGYIADEAAYQLELSNRDIASTLKNLPNALTIADAAEPKSIAEIKLYGVNIVGSEKGPESKRYGIKTLQNQRISVTRRSVNLLKEYRNYLWKVDKAGNVLPGYAEEGNDHCLDALRYALCSLIPIQQQREMLRHLSPAPPRQRVNPAL